MQIKELMTGNVETISSNSTVRNAAEKMSELNVGFLPVAENGSTLGVLTDRDIALRVVGAGRNPEETTVRNIMSAGTAHLSEESDVQDAVDLMSKKKIRRVLVQGKNSELAGVLSLGDIAVADDELCAKALKEISEPCKPER